MKHAFAALGTLLAAIILAAGLHAAHAQFSPPAATPSTVVGGPVGVPAVVNTSPQTSFLDVGQAFSQAMAPFINAALQGILATGLAWLGYVLNKKFKINITEGQRATVQTWLTNQASSLIADGAVKIEGGKVSVNKDALEAHAHQYATQIPDAAKFFGLTPDVVAAKIVDKIPQVPAGASLIAQSAPVTPPPAVIPGAPA